MTVLSDSSHKIRSFVNTHEMMNFEDRSCDVMDGRGERNLDWLPSEPKHVIQCSYIIM